MDQIEIYDVKNRKPEDGQYVFAICPFMGSIVGKYDAKSGGIITRSDADWIFSWKYWRPYLHHQTSKSLSALD